MKSRVLSVTTFYLACAAGTLGFMLTAADLGVFLAEMSPAPDLSDPLQTGKLVFLLCVYLVASFLLAFIGWKVSRASSAQRQVVVSWSAMAVLLWFLSSGYLLLVYYPLPSHPHHLDKLLLILGSVLVWSLWFTLYPLGLAQVLNSRWYEWTKVALINLLVFVVLGEAVLRVTDPVLGRSGLFEREHSSGWLKPHRETEGSIGRTNSKGFRDQERTFEKPASTVRVVALGDSFTWGTGVTYDETVVTMLERSLQKLLPQSEILNLGVPGFEPEHELDMMQQFGIKFSPDVVVLYFFVGNDIMRKRGAGRDVPFIVAGNSYYVHSNGNWVHDYLGLDRSYLYHHLRYLVRVHFSQLWGLFRKQGGVTWNLARAEASLPPGGWHMDYVKYLVERSEIFAKDDTPEWNYHWRHTTATLDSLLELLRSHQIPLLVVLIPEKVQLDPDLQREFVSAMGTSTLEYDFEKPQRQLGAWCARHDVICVDLFSTWKECPASRRLYFRNDAHWTRDGHACAAAATLPILYETIVHKTAYRDGGGGSGFAPTGTSNAISPLPPCCFQ
jgi:hypothetical protein